MKRALAAGLFAALYFGGCAGCQRPLPTPEPGDGGVDAGPIADAAAPDAGPRPAGDVCDQALAHLQQLGCPPKAPETGTWTDACRNARAHGLTFQAQCHLQATSCLAAFKCE